jgi:hypothetical protein
MTYYGLGNILGDILINSSGHLVYDSPSWHWFFSVVKLSRFLRGQEQATAFEKKIVIH